MKINQMEVWIVIYEDHGKFGISGVYNSKELAREALKMAVPIPNYSGVRYRIVKEGVNGTVHVKGNVNTGTIYVKGNT